MRGVASDEGAERRKSRFTIQLHPFRGYRPRRSLEGVVVIEGRGFLRGGAVPSRDNSANAAAGRPLASLQRAWLQLRSGYHSGAGRSLRAWLLR